MRAEPLVLQPPLPLQLFLPLQPWSPVLQPPWPLQSFLPLQSWVEVVPSIARAFTPALPSITVLTEVAWVMPVVAAVAWLDAPPINPAKAAAASKPVDPPKIFVLRFMVRSFRLTIMVIHRD